MHNTVVGKIDNFQQIVRFRDSVNQCLSYEMYNKWLDSDDFKADATSATIPSFTGPTSGSVYPGWIFVDGKNGYVTCVYRRHREWRNGSLAARIHYTCSTNTGTIAGQLSIVPVSNDDAMPSPNFASITLEPPTTAGGLQKYSPAGPSDYTQVNPSNDLIVIFFGREDTDDSAGNMTFIGMELIYKEYKNRVSSRLNLTS